MKLTQEYLNELFEYQDGVLIRKTTKGNVKIGSVAGCKNILGYIHVVIDKKCYKAHRLIYLMHYGCLPRFLDHIDGVRDNNKIENLRPASRKQNNWNSKLRKDSSTKHKGVCWRKSHNKYYARIKVNKKSIHLGYHADINDAIRSVNEARKKLHGEFARYK
jgi:hypothetical protein